jgi:hypothetical protein
MSTRASEPPEAGATIRLVAYTPKLTVKLAEPEAPATPPVQVRTMSLTLSATPSARIRAGVPPLTEQRNGPPWAETADVSRNVEIMRTLNLFSAAASVTKETESERFTIY